MMPPKRVSTISLFSVINASVLSVVTTSPCLNSSHSTLLNHLNLGIVSRFYLRHFHYTTYEFTNFYLLGFSPIFISKLLEIIFQILFYHKRVCFNSLFMNILLYILNIYLTIPSIQKTHSNSMG